MNTLRRRGAGRIVWICSGIVCGCTRLVEPPLDPRAIPLTLPPVYGRWWSMTQACSGLSGSLSDVTWYVVPNATVINSSGDQVSGYYTVGNHTIVLAGKSLYDGGTVRHEMLHALRRLPGHPRSDFLDKCGGVVDCATKCIADAGPIQIDPSITRVGSEVLEVAVRLLPAHPTMTEDGGVFTVIVTARNPRSNAVAIEGVPLLQSFYFELLVKEEGIKIGIPVRDAGVTLFAAGEIKQQLFDLIIGSNFDGFLISPGEYSLIGGYDRHYVSREGVLIGP
jgi:hypothetical protein